MNHYPNITAAGLYLERSFRVATVSRTHKHTGEERQDEQTEKRPRGPGKEKSPAAGLRTPQRTRRKMAANKARHKTTPGWQPLLVPSPGAETATHGAFLHVQEPRRKAGWSLGSPTKRARRWQPRHFNNCGQT